MLARITPPAENALYYVTGDIAVVFELEGPLGVVERVFAHVGPCGCGTTLENNEELLDHVIGAGKNRWRDSEFKCLGRLEVHDELELSGLLDRQVFGSQAA